jgi:type II secretory ATPase GspE/PulE/Tfp pilus assembly ATPase PilB-like protein
MGMMQVFRRKPRELTVDEVIAYQVDAGELDLPALPGSVKQIEKHSFAQFLLAKNLVDPIQVDAALKEQKVNNDPLGQILVRNGFLSPSDLVDCVLEHNPERIATEAVTTSRVPVEILERMNIIITAETETAVFVGTMSDEDKVEMIIREHYPDKRVHFVAFVPDKMPGFIDLMRRTNAGMDDGDIRQDEMMERLIYRSLKDVASDIHIEPRTDSYAVFFRCLGERRLMHMGPLDEYNTIVSQLKDRSRMDLAERRIGQDGGFQVEYSGKFVDLRVATVPAVEGEQVIIRILDPDRVRPKLEQLGISRVSEWKRGITRKNGLCLICGETGSGKTTTLNASVRELDRFGKKIYTAEDPVEYRIPFVGQVNTNSAVGYGFAQAIRNFMRADPDVMILGEVRDEDTARNAVKAAETGHLVVATLHTGNIISSLSRLRDLNIPPHELRFILRSVLVQTLVKVVCQSCKGHGATDDGVCPVCSGSGYSDRTILSECTSFMTYADVDRIIDMTDPKKKDQFNGAMPWDEMIDDGIAKMMKGITTSDELKRVFGSQFDDRIVQMGFDPEKYVLAKNRGKGVFNI